MSDPMSPYLRAGVALKEFAPEMGPIQRTALVQVVLDAALGEPHADRLTLYETALRKLQNAAAAYVHPQRRISAEELIDLLLATVDDRELFRALRGDSAMVDKGMERPEMTDQPKPLADWLRTEALYLYGNPDWTGPLTTPTLLNEAADEIQLLQGLLAFAARKLEDVQDEGPEGEGWQSSELISWLNECRSAVDKGMEKQE
jgi:hypothetical protein